MFYSIAVHASIVENFIISCGLQHDCPLQVSNDGTDPLRATHSLPDGLVVKQSGISGAGSGVWAEKLIPRGVRFGPYEGEITYNEDRAHDSGYCWQVGLFLR